MSRSFRVWDNERHKYVGDCVIEFKIYGVETSVVVCPNSQEYAYDSCHDYYNEGRFVIEQSTGLKDKNGKEIYEGDIITETYSASKDGLYKENGEYKVEDYWVVKYNVKRAGFSPFCDCSTEGEYLYEEYIPKSYVEVEVLGNIHENPELLEN